MLKLPDAGRNFKLTLEPKREWWLILEWQVLVPVCSVPSVYSVVRALKKLTTEYTENTEKIRNKKGRDQ
jgi:hypothetical protein